MCLFDKAHFICFVYKAYIQYLCLKQTDDALIEAIVSVLIARIHNS